MDWDQINPQPDNSDEGFDLEGDVPSIQERRVLNRVDQWTSAVEISDEANQALGNENEVEIDFDFETKRRSLIDHFSHAYHPGLVHWPRCFNEQEQAHYNKGRM